MGIEQLSFLENLSVQHIEKMHKNSKGYISHVNKDEEWKQWHYIVSVLISEIDKIVQANEYYMSQNTFYRPCRRLEYIKELRALYIDIDYYNTNYSKEAVLYNLEQDYFNKLIPMPSLIIDSGRGIYLIWRLEEGIPGMALPLWKAIENNFYEKLKKFGADRKALEPTRVLRVAGSINKKSNTVVKIIDNFDYEYSLREIQEEYLPELPKDWKEKKKGRPRKLVTLCNAYNLHYARIKDLVKLCELREWNLGGNGRGNGWLREQICFLYRYWNCCYLADEEEALRQTLEFNSQFTEPLNQREVERATRSAERAYEAWSRGEYVEYKGKKQLKGYNYKNDSLIELLEISEEEEMQLDTIISKREKKRRNNNYNKEKRRQQRRNEEGLTKRQQWKQNKIEVVKELRGQGFKQKEIAEKLGITKGTVSKYLKL